MKFTASKPDLKLFPSTFSRFCSYLTELIENRPFSVLLFLLLITGFIVFKDYLLLHKYYIFKDIGSDTYNQEYPIYVHYANYFRTDGMPRWSFNTGMGQSIFPGETSNPLTLLMVLCGAKYVAPLIIYVEFAKILLTGIFIFFYLKIMNISKLVCIIGSLIFAFSGYMIIGSEWYIFSSYMLYISFFLFAFEKFLMQGNWKYLPFSIIFISTYPFAMYAFFLFLIFYIPIRYLEEFDFKIAHFFKFLLKLGGLAVLGLIMSFVFWGPTMVIVMQSPRVAGSAGYFNLLKQLPVFALGDKLHYMTAILRLISTDILGAGSNFRGWYNYLEAPVFYTGLISLVAIPQLFIFSKNKNRIAYGITFLVWFLVVLFPYFRHAVNLFAGDYYKVSVSYIVTLMLFYFSVRSLELIFSKYKIKVIAIVIILLVLITALFYPYFHNSQQLIDKNLRLLITGLLLIWAIVLILYKYDRFRVYLKPLILIILCFELGLQAYSGVNKRMVLTATEARQKTGYNDYTVEAVRFIKSIDNGFYRVNKDYFSGSAIHSSLNEAHIQNFYGTPSYMSFNEKSYIDFLIATGIIPATNENSSRWSIGLLTRPLLQTMASVKYNLSKPGGADYTAFGYQSIGTFGNVTVLRNEFFLPLGFTYDKYIPQSIFNQLPPFFKDIALLKAVVIPDNDVSRFPGLNAADLAADSIYQTNYNFEEFGTDISNRRQGSMILSIQKQNIIKGTVDLAKRKLVFFSIPFDNGWKAKVDGKKAVLLQANIGFMGLLLDAGKHEIELKFTPPYMKAGLFVTFLGLVLYFLLIFLLPKLSKNSTH